MNTREVYRMVDGTVVGRRTATLTNVQLHGTQCVYSAMCFTNCCVHTNVLNVYTQVLRKLTSVAVLLRLLRSSNFISNRTVRGRFKVIGIWMTWTVRGQRWKIATSSDVTSITERLVYDDFKDFTLYNLTSSAVVLLTSFYQSTELTECTAIWIGTERFAESELKSATSWSFPHFKIAFIWIIYGNLFSEK